MQDLETRSNWTPVPILMLHAVFPDARPEFPINLQVTHNDIASHLAILKRWGYTGITFETLAAALRYGSPLPRRPVIITFDDGFDGLLKAHPIFEAARFPYTIFVVAACVGKTNSWDRSHNIPELPLLSWEAIAELDRSEFVSVQPHTLTHPSLPELNSREAENEIAGSKARLEDRLGKEATVFCYPYGHYNDETVRIVRQAGYACAVTMDRGRVRQDEDLFRLPRISVQHRPFFSLSKGFASIEFVRRLRYSQDRR
ncbi:MAG: polysaccharide deacetylase family protein [Capsulimonadaceae bacterium]|nr:polysaccharide deacetylase family protein [Capsulimonadaceae bacterium]